MIVELLIYSCITTHTISDDSFTKSCRWSSRGYYSSERRCAEDGAAEAGKIEHEFSVVRGASPRLVERHKCSPVPVRE